MSDKFEISLPKAPLSFKVAKEIAVLGKNRSFLIPLDHRWLYFREDSNGKLEAVGGMEDDIVNGMDTLFELRKSCERTKKSVEARISSLSKDLLELKDETSMIRKAITTTGFPIPVDELILQLSSRIETYRGYIKFSNDLRWDVEILLDRYKGDDTNIPSNVKTQVDEIFSNLFSNPNSSSKGFEPEVKSLFDSLSSLFKKGNTDESKSRSTKDSSGPGESKAG